MNMTKNLLREAVGLLGAAMVTYGMWEVHPALGYGVAGVFLMAGAMLSAMNARSR
jgi:uncharacterized membrane protein YdcZ (DUF606 family)